MLVQSLGIAGVADDSEEPTAVSQLLHGRKTEIEARTIVVSQLRRCRGAIIAERITAQSIIAIDSDASCELRRSRLRSNEAESDSKQCTAQEMATECRPSPAR